MATLLCSVQQYVWKQALGVSIYHTVTVIFGPIGRVKSGWLKHWKRSWAERLSILPDPRRSFLHNHDSTQLWVEQEERKKPNTSLFGVRSCLRVKRNEYTNIISISAILPACAVFILSFISNTFTLQKFQVVSWWTWCDVHYECSLWCPVSKNKYSWEWRKVGFHLMWSPLSQAHVLTASR